MSDQDTTITADGLGQMLDQFNESVNLRKLASSYLDQCQALEDAAWPLLAERGLDNATGDRLDRIGQIIDMPRGGRTDDNYRLALQIEIAVLLSNGLESELVAIAQMLVQMTTPDYEFIEYYPKTVYLRAVDWAAFTATSHVTGATLRRAVSAGTELHYIGSEYAAAFQYRLSDTADTSESDADTGLANDTQTTGGRLSEAY